MRAWRKRTTQVAHGVWVVELSRLAKVAVLHEGIVKTIALFLDQNVVEFDVSVHIAVAMDLRQTTQQPFCNISVLATTPCSSMSNAGSVVESVSLLKRKHTQA